MAIACTPEQAVERVRLVPDAHRTYTESVERARRYHGIADSLLRQLLDLGLPHRGMAGDLRLDRLDLENIGLMLMLSCPRRSAMRWWSESFVTAPWLTFEVELSADVTWISDNPQVTDVRPAEVGHTATVRLPGAKVLFDSPYAELLEHLRTAEFHLIPQSLAGDIGFFRETGLANCSLGSLYLEKVAREMGLRVTVASGLILAAPFSIGHAWVSVLVDGEWLAADPLLLRSCATWGICDPAEWPLNRSPQAVLWKTSAPRHWEQAPSLTRRIRPAV
jgi:hypothetical protein